MLLRKFIFLVLGNLYHWKQNNLILHIDGNVPLVKFKQSLKLYLLKSFMKNIV